MGIDPNLLCYHRPSLPLNNMSSTIRQRRKTHFLCLIFKRVPFRCNVQRTRRKHLWPVSCCGWSEEWFGPTSLISHLSLDIIYKKRVTDLKCECRHTILHFFFLCPLSSFYPPLTCSSECAPSLTISLSLSLSPVCVVWSRFIIPSSRATAEGVWLSWNLIWQTTLSHVVFGDISYHLIIRGTSISEKLRLHTI